MAKVAIIYYSSTGTTYQLAKAVEEGAREAGAETRLLKVRETAPEAAMDDLTWADAVIFGTPTRYGGATSQLRAFIDQTGGLWASGALANKIGSSFTSTATSHGGQESTILSLNTIFYHWGAIIVAPGYVDPIQFQSGNPYGVSFTSQNGAVSPDEVAINAARFQGRRVAEVTAQFLKGKE